MRESLRVAVGDRLNDSTLNKVVRNASSSWTQSGHLRGRTFKHRALVKPTPATIALALYLGYAAGFRAKSFLHQLGSRYWTAQQHKLVIWLIMQSDSES
jgi:hypothetical protein